MTEKPKEGCFEQIIALGIGLLVMPVTYALWGWATSKLWGWFVVPQFNLAPLSVPMAIGVSLVLSQFKRRQASEKGKTSAEIVAESIVFGVLGPLTALGIGAVVHRWFV